MPSIWITSKSNPERSDASHFFICAVESATKRRETADFDRPDPAGDATSPSGSRTERLNLRVDTLPPVPADAIRGLLAARISRRLRGARGLRLRALRQLERADADSGRD